jgi:hypothetical protein
MDICFLYDIVRGNVDCAELIESVGYNVPTLRARRRLPPLLLAPKTHTNYARNAPISRLPQTYNNVFKEIDLFNNSKIAKTQSKLKQKLFLMTADFAHWSSYSAFVQEVTGLIPSLSSKLFGFVICIICGLPILLLQGSVCMDWNCVSWS